MALTRTKPMPITAEPMVVEQSVAGVSAPADSRTGLAAWYLRVGARAAWIAPLTPALLAFFFLLLLRGTAENPNTNVERSETDVLAQAPAAVPNAENAGPAYMAAATKFVRWTGANEGNPLTNVYGRGTFFDDPAVKAHLAANANVIAAFIAASQMERCNFGLDYRLNWAIALPQLSKMREGARLLAAYARAQAHAGNHAAAAVALSAIYHMAQHTSSDPIYISGLVSVSMANIADYTLSSIMLWDAPTRQADLAAYRDALWVHRDPYKLMMRCLTCEKMIGLHGMDSMACSAMTSSTGPRVFGISQNQMSAYLTFCYGSDRRCYAQVMDELIQRAARELPPEKDDRMELVEKLQTGPALMTRMTVPLCNRGASSFVNCEQDGRMAETALAFMQFRLKNGRDATTIEELVPEFLPAIPVDPFHNHPLRIGTTPVQEKEPWIKEIKADFGSGVVRIYSLGENGRDDLGLMSNLEAAGGRDDKSFLLPPLKKEH